MAVPRNDWVQADELAKRTMNTMRGKMCSLIEGMDLPSHQQEEAVITLLKQFSYEAQDVLAQLIEELDEGSHSFRYNNKALEVQ